MRPIGNMHVAVAAAILALVVGTFASDVGATPNPNSAVLNTRVFNDCPTSVLSTTNSYPASISMHDANLGCFGFANLHNWQFSEDGINPVLFDNGDNFRFSADLVISGATDGEAGLMISPWWSPDVDGRFNVRSTDGEIACFGGRLPFYSFTASDGVVYTKGTSINLEVVYLANDLTSANPATIEYKVTYGGMNYSSGPLPFDMGNPTEDPPHGVWGMLTPARAGGHFQCFLQGGNPAAEVMAEWSNIQFEELDPDDVVIIPRVFNDCPTSVLTTLNNYPNSIFVEDAVLGCFGFANLHVWRFSEDGINPREFDNESYFRFGADLVIDGPTDGEAGLMISPWWSPHVDGRLNVRSTDGEIACFGGRLPFYSFTASDGVTYVKGTSIHLEITYLANGLSAASPATVEYKVGYDGMTYSSGPLPFDMGNPAEDPPHGLWGMLTPAFVGGHFQAFLQGGNNDAAVMARWSNLQFQDLTPVAVDLDIKPGSCPNPLNIKSKGVTPVAILGTADFDVTEIDVATVRLEGVMPKRSSYEDVGTPYSDEACGCTEEGPDGITDLTLKFSTPVLVEAVMPAPDGELMLTLTGNLLDGTPITGQDCVVTRGFPKDEIIPAPGVDPDEEEDTVPSFGFLPGGSPQTPVQEVRFSIPEASLVELVVYDVSGREVKRLVRSERGPGEHTVQWNTAGLASGMYFYSLQAGSKRTTQKVLIVH